MYVYLESSDNLMLWEIVTELGHGKLHYTVDGAVNAELVCILVYIRNWSAKS